MSMCNMFSISQKATYRGNLVNAVDAYNGALNSWLHLPWTETELKISFLLVKF